MSIEMSLHDLLPQDTATGAAHAEEKDKKTTMRRREGMKKTGTTWKRRALAFALSAGMVMNSFHGLVSVPYYVYASDVVLDETGTDTDGFYEITGDQDSIAAQLAALVETETSDTGSSEDTESERLTEASGDMDELTVMNIEVADEVPVGLGGVTLKRYKRSTRCYPPAKNLRRTRMAFIRSVMQRISVGWLNLSMQAMPK